MKIEEFLEKWGYRILPGLGQALFDFKNELKADLESLEKELPPEKELTIEEITKIIEELWFDREPPQEERKILFYTPCIVYNWIDRSKEIYPFHCQSKVCVGCNHYLEQFHKAVIKEFGKQEI